MINKSLVRQRFNQAIHSYDQHADAQQRINHILVSLLTQHACTVFQQVFEIGCGTALLTKQLQQHCQIKQWILNDLCPLQDYIQQKLPQLNFKFIEGDIETLDFPAGNDMIASASAVQWLNYPQLFIKKCAQHLNESGYLLLSTFTENNFKEIKQLTGIGLNYPNMKDWQVWLQNDFDLLICQQEDWSLYFESPLHVLQHLKLTGVSGITRKTWTKTQLHKFIQNYQQDFGLTSGKVSLSYSPLFILARKK